MISLKEIELLQQQQMADSSNGLMAIKGMLDLVVKVHSIIDSYFKKYEDYESNTQRNEAIKAGIEKRFTLEEAEKDDVVYFETLRIVNATAYFSAALSSILKVSPLTTMEKVADEMHKELGPNFFGDGYYKDLLKEARNVFRE